MIPNIKQAVQLGEKKAKDFGFDSFPVNPLEIAEKCNITVHKKPPEQSGISGALIFNNGAFDLIYSTEFDIGFQNFSVAHELGHYFLPGHPDEIQNSGSHISRSGFRQNDPMELEADHFASGLLMPSQMVRSFLGKKQIGLDAILGLAEKANTSITAAAIRAAECSEYPMAIIMSKEDKIAYSFLSDSFKDLGRLRWLKKDSPLPSSATKTFNAVPHNVLNCNRDCQQSTLQIWFGSEAQTELDEEIVGLGAYGYTLTVLSSDSLPLIEDYDDDDESSLEESWTPRFAYNR